MFLNSLICTLLHTWFIDLNKSVFIILFTVCLLGLRVDFFKCIKMFCITNYSAIWIASTWFIKSQLKAQSDPQNMILKDLPVECASIVMYCYLSKNNSQIYGEILSLRVSVCIYHPMRKYNQVCLTTKHALLAFRHYFLFGKFFHPLVILKDEQTCSD